MDLRITSCRHDGSKLTELLKSTRPERELSGGVEVPSRLQVFLLLHNLFDKIGEQRLIVFPLKR